MSNLTLTIGDFSAYNGGNDSSYTFRYIDFGKVELGNFDVLPKSSEMMDIMAGKEVMIFIEKIANTSSIIPPPPDDDGSSGESSSDGSSSSSETTGLGLSHDKINSVDCARYDNYPSAIGLQRSIIPQPIIPSRTWKGADNGVVINSDSSHATLLGAGTDWTATSLISIASDLGYGVVKGTALYGIRQSNLYVNNSTALYPGVDMPTIATRTYSAVGTSGAFSIAYKFSVYNSSPEIEFTTNVTTGLKNVPSTLKISIPPTQQITVDLGVKKNGSFSTPQGALLPPACVKTAQGYTNEALFVIPLFTGLVVTNNIAKSTLSEADVLFIPFNSRSNPLEFLNVKLPSGLEGFSSAQKNKQKFKYIPNAIKEAEAKDAPKNFEVKDTKNFELSNSSIKFSFEESVGSFAFCPLYFHRNIKLHVIFKGHFPTSLNGTDANNGTYNLYPIFCSGSDSWTISTINPGNAYAEDRETEQAVYKGTIDCCTSDMVRNPIQLFGCVISLKKNNVGLNLSTSNGSFCLDSSLLNMIPWESFCSVDSGKIPWSNFITKCNVQCGLDGVNGQIVLDGYALYGSNVFSKIMPSQSVGGISIAADGGTIFKGFAMEIAKSSQENNYDVTINLAGVQKKLQDMKLINCPFFDGDKLSDINNYFMAYSGVQVQMLAGSGSGGVSSDLSSDGSSGGSGGWTSQIPLIGGNTNTEFRVGVSWNWESPHINFQTGKPLWDAYQELAKDTSCVFAVGLDGVGYFYELDNYGKPTCINQAPMEIPIKQIISLNLSPHISNMYNNLVTVGFIVKNNQNLNSKGDTVNNMVPGIFHTNIPNLFPWTRHSLSVAKGALTKAQLYMLHKNRVRFAKLYQYQGSLTIKGKSSINRLYKTISIGGEKFFVISIQHSLDLSGKIWTTTYGIQTIGSSNGLTGSN